MILFGVILSEEMRWKSTGETLGNVLNMENKGRQKDRGKGSGNRENSRKGRSKSRLGNIECWNCGKKGDLNKTAELQRNKEMESRRKIKKQM
jgi:hypothetical protein